MAYGMLPGLGTQFGAQLGAGLASQMTPTAMTPQYIGSALPDISMGYDRPDLMPQIGGLDVTPPTLAAGPSQVNLPTTTLAPQGIEAGTTFAPPQAPEPYKDIAGGLGAMGQGFTTLMDAFRPEYVQTRDPGRSAEYSRWAGRLGFGLL